MKNFLLIGYEDWEGDFGSLSINLENVYAGFNGKVYVLDSGRDNFIAWLKNYYYNDSEVFARIDIDNEVYVRTIQIHSDLGLFVYNINTPDDFVDALEEIKEVKEELGMDINKKIKKAVERKLVNKVANGLVGNKSKKGNDMIKTMFMWQMLQNMSNNQNNT